MSQCMIFHQANKVLVAKGICCNMSLDIDVGLSFLLGDTHIVGQISFNLSVVDVPDHWRYSI